VPIVLADDLSNRGVRIPDVPDGSSVSEQRSVEPQHEARSLVVPMHGKLSDITASREHERLPLPHKHGDHGDVGVNRPANGHGLAIGLEA
jgi:hypothetical protein